MPREEEGRPLADRLFAAPTAYVPLTNYYDSSLGIITTAKFQAALDDGGTSRLPVYGGSLTIAIDSGLTMSPDCPGMLFDRANYGAPSDPGILVTGTGYTALTCPPMIIGQFRVNIYGTGNACNGLLMNNVQQSSIGKIRVFNLDGFGFKAIKSWDNTFIDISVELCGNASNYAFSLEAGDDTSNETHIMRLQVEQAKYQAIKIDGSSLSCVIDCVHSERATADLAYTTWDFGSTRGVYNAVRLTALNPTQATAIFRGENCTLNSPAVEGDVSIVLDAMATSAMLINSPNFNDGRVSLLLSDHTGLVKIQAGMINTFNASGELGRKSTLQCDGTKIQTASIGDVGNPSLPHILKFINADIGTLASTSTNSAATFDSCEIHGGALLQGLTVLQNGTTWDGLVAIAVPGTGACIVRDSTINVDVTVTSGGSLIGEGCKIFGSFTDNGTASLMDSRSFVTGAVSRPATSGWGAPTTAPNARALLGGSWHVGQRQHNIAAVAGGPPGWVNTTTGWKAEANLAA